MTDRKPLPDTSHQPARLTLATAPEYAWSFEPHQDFAFEVENLSSQELADPAAVRDIQYTADVYRDGSLIRRVGVAPLPSAIPVGEKRVFEADLGISVVGGDYEMSFGLERGNGGPPIEFAAPRHALHVKNTIFEPLVELINACNFRCSFCPQGELKRKQRPMDFDLAKKILRDFADMGQKHPIRCHLLGEPLLYPRFFDFVEEAHDVGQRILLVTNGSRFQEENIEDIFRTKLDQLLISLNTPEREGYNEQRGTNMPFETYMHGIERMVEEAVKRDEGPETMINVLYDQSKTDDPQEIRRVNGLANQWVNVVRRITGQKELSVEEVDHFDPSLRTEIQLYDNLRIMFQPYHSWGEGQSPELHFCAFPWKQLAILVDGQATACCVDSEGEINLGNVREQTVEEIWNGPEITRIRDSFWNKQRAVEPRCIRCPIRHHELAEMYLN